MTKALFPAQQIKRGKTRTALIGQGQRMANWMFNMKQSDRLPSDIREELRMMQESWDGILLPAPPVPSQTAKKEEK